MAKKKAIDKEINEFLETWNIQNMIDFLRDVIPLVELFDYLDENDWLKEAVGEEDERNVRIIRSVYLMSRIADFHAGRLCTLKFKYKELWKKMKKVGIEDE